MARPEPVRVLRVIARLNKGGPALHVAYLAAGLEERGYKTTLVAGSLARGEGSMVYVAEERGVEVVALPDLHREISPFHDLRAAHRLAGPASLELEEGQQLYFAQWLSVVYDSHPPFYNWLQYGVA